MTKKRWLYAAALICGLLVFTMSSCSNSEGQMEEQASVAASVNHRLTAEQATKNALAFIEQYGATSRAGQKLPNVAEVKAFSVDEGSTRAEDNSINLDSLFYVINFADNKGFVIASSDDREAPVFAYVEEGTFEDSDTLNNGYEAFVGALIESEITHRNQPLKVQALNNNNEPAKGGGGGGGRKPDKFEVMYPLLKTKWDQTTYNSYCSGHKTGCVVTAISQICSFLKSPNHVSWSYNGVGNQCNIDWDEIINECMSNSGNTTSIKSKDQVANLMRFWGVAFDADYSSNGTSVNSDKAISKMRELGYNATKLTNYDASNVINDLKKGDRIIYMRGNARYYHVGFVFRKYVDGHGWVIDGYIDSCKNNEESLYVHCNWGWGGTRNGYFLSDVLNAEEEPYYDDNASAITRSNNYRYKLKTSTICK
jgi:hypothetical protein